MEKEIKNNDEKELNESLEKVKISKEFIAENVPDITDIEYIFDIMNKKINIDYEIN